jgi:hypothetical protein
VRSEQIADVRGQLSEVTTKYDVIVVDARLIVGFLDVLPIAHDARRRLTFALTRAARVSYNMKQQRHRGVE